MGRNYAGILGTLAFATVVARALLASGGVQAALGQATLALVVGAVVGCLLGTAAEVLVRDSVRAIVAAGIKDARRAPPTGGATPG